MLCQEAPHALNVFIHILLLRNMVIAIFISVNIGGTYTMHVIGHISIDKIVDPPNGNIIMSAGGAPTYCGFYLSQLDVHITPISVVGPDFDGLGHYKERGIVDRWNTGGANMQDNIIRAQI